MPNLKGYIFVFIASCAINILFWQFSFRSSQTAECTVKQGTQIDIKQQWFEGYIDEYIAWHNSVIDKQDPNLKYSTCWTNAGWGNRFQQALSCILYSMISRRVVVLQHDNNYFHQHFSSFFKDPPIRLKNYPQWIEPGEIWYADAGTVQCNNLETFLQEKRFLNVYPPGAYDFWGQSILYNIHHDYLHKIPSNWYQILLRKMFVLSESLQMELDNFKQQHFGPFTVGIQVRTWSRNVAGADALRNPNIPIDVFLQAGEIVSMEAPIPFNDVKFLIVTPDKDYLNKAYQVYGKDRVIFLDGEINERTELGRLLNYWLMGDCNELIVSEISSYGTNAAARTGLKPVVCTHERVCYRRLTSDPCQDAPYPIRKSSCIKDERNIYVPGVQSTCAYFGYLRQHRKWFDLYNSWNWTLEYGQTPSWQLGDTNGYVY